MYHQPKIAYKAHTQYYLLIFQMVQVNSEGVQINKELSIKFCVQDN